jgi:hypothetical protein
MFGVRGHKNEKMKNIWTSAHPRYIQRAVLVLSGENQYSIFKGAKPSLLEILLHAPGLSSLAAPCFAYV